MKTPITDAIWDQAKGIPEYHAKLEETARLLELDRASLMEALEKVEATDQKLPAHVWRSVLSALAAARANFPES